MRDIILAILATYRLSRLVADDQAAVPLRAWAGRRASGQPTGSPAFLLAELVNCPYCLGVWFAAFLALLLKPGSAREWVLTWLAIAGGQALVQEIVDR